MKVLSIALSLISTLALVESQSCTLNNLIVKGSCSVSSIYTADNACNESSLQVLLGADYISKIEIACNEAQQVADDGMLPWSAVTKRGYQFDKEFFNGGTIFNTETDSIAFSQDTSRLSKIRDDLLHKHGIGWPSNIDNFNEETSCEMNTAMCCWVASRDLETHASGEPSDNTDVCSHSMGNSPRSAHVENGESVFVGDSGPVNCHGFYWDDGERYKGNLLFHVAMSKGLLDNGYVRNIPGAPMCGCVEQMPVVTHSDCTAMTVDEDFRITFEDSLLKIQATGDPAVEFTPCPGDGSLTGGYTSAQLPGNIESYVTGKQDECAEEEADALDTLAYKKRASDEQWVPVAGKGYMFNPSLSVDDFNALFAKSPNQIVRRRCMECEYTHKDIYYRRYDVNGLPANFDLLYILKNYWHDIDGNKFHINFELYSSYDDALNNRNPWLFCNFNDRTVGFPRDCGPINKIDHQWNAFEPLDGRHHGKYHVGFYVEGENNKLGSPKMIDE